MRFCFSQGSNQWPNCRSTCAATSIRKGLAIFGSAYEATIMALESNRAKLASDLADFERAVSAGETGAWEYDEYGEVLYSRERLHELLIKDATSAITVAREAY